MQIFRIGKHVLIAGAALSATGVIVAGGAIPASLILTAPPCLAEASDVKRADKLAIVDKLLNQAKTSKGYAFARQAAKDHFLGKLKGALLYCDLALGQDSKLAVAYLIKGLVYDDLEESTDAVDNLSRAQQLNPQCADAHFYEVRSMNYIAMGKYDLAMTDANKALGLQPKSGSYIKLRGDIYTKMKKYDQALACYGASLKLLPDNEKIWTARAVCYIDMAHYKDALADLSQAIHLRPTSAEYSMRATVYDKIGNKDLALKDREMSKSKGL